ncbi:MAG: hypothetical protein QM775_11650 [Pirellulales bacterium]
MSYPRFDESQLGYNDPQQGGGATTEPVARLRPQDNTEADEIAAVFKMRPYRSREAALKLVWAALSGMLGGFLLAQIRETPGLAVNIAIIGGLGITAALVLTTLAVRELTSRLTIDRREIAWSPAWTGFRIVWDAVESWEMTDDYDRPSPIQQLKIYLNGKRVPVLVDTSWMTSASRSTLRRVLTTIAPDKHAY